MTVPTDIPASPASPLPEVARTDFARSEFPPPLRSPDTLTVLDITKYFGETTGGIRTYLLAKAAYVQARRAVLRQVLVVPGAEDGIGERDGVRCYRLRGPRIPFDRSYRFLLATRTTQRIFRHERPDVVEVGSPWLVPWVVRHANRDLRLPLVWFYHTHFPAIIAGAGGAARRMAGNLAWNYVRQLAAAHRAVLVASASVARQLETEGVANVHRVRLGTDLDAFHPARRERREPVRRMHGLPDAPLAIYLGRFTEEKQLETVLAAWPEVTRRTGAHLALVGAGPREGRLRALAPPTVHWLPYVRSREEVASLLGAADLYVAPGPAETFGLSALEAMASGLPVLSVAEGGVADRVRESGAGALYPAGGAGACAEVAIALFADNLRRLGAAARMHAERFHSWPDALDGIFDVYRRVAAKDLR